PWHPCELTVDTISSHCYPKRVGEMQTKDCTSSRPVRERGHRKWQHTTNPLTAIASTLTTRKTWLKWRACLGKITTSPKEWVDSYPSGLTFPASTASLTLPAALEVGHWRSPLRIPRLR